MYVIKKSLASLSLFLFVVISPLLPAFGQSSGEVSSGYSVWIPKKMIVGQDYQGIIVLDRPSSDNSLLFLSTSDKSRLDVPQSINISPFTNHGIFQIKPLKNGNATVFAALQGNLVQADTTIYQSNTQPASLRIILPTNITKAQNMLAYVFSQDQFGLPAPVNLDSELFVTTTSTIEAPATITIPKGQYYAQLPLITKGSGTVSVAADGLGLATAKITKVHDDIKVRLAVAPDIAVPNSAVYYYVWLEKEGKPFKPPYTINAVLSSSDTDVARFGNTYDVTHFNDITYSTKLKDGIAKGIIYTRNFGNSTISVSVEGVGSATALLIAGPALFNSVALTSNTVSNPVLSVDETTASSFCSKLSSCKPNLVKVWVYPSVFDDKSYGIVSLYHFTNNTNQNIVVPLAADSSIVQISSNSQDLQYDKEIEMIPARIPGTNQEIGVAAAVEFPIAAGEEGNYTITASGAGKIFGTAPASIIPRYFDSYNVAITSLPAKTGITQDLGIMYISDGSGAMVEPSSVFSEPPDVEIKTIIKDVPKKLQFTSTNMALAGTLSDKADISASIPGLSSASVTIFPLDIATNVEFDLPPRIHVGEKFPFVAHKVDSFGVPLQQLVPQDLSAASGVTVDPLGQYMTINKEGKVTVAILADTGAITKEVDSFYNEMHLSTDANNTIFKVGKPNAFKVTADVENASYDLQSIIPVTQTAPGQFSISPDREGAFDVTIFAHKDGFKPLAEILHFISKKIIDISVTATGNDGTVLHLVPLITVNNQSIISNTPFEQSTGAGQVHIEIPPQFNVGDNNYALNNVDISGQKFSNGKIDLFLADDSKIQASYDRVLKVNATYAGGGGLYSYGATATLHAPDKWEISFLVRQVFDHWEGNNLPFDSRTNDVSFVVKENVFVTAVYKQDSTYLMLVIAGPVTGFFVLKKRDTITWHVKELEEKIKQFVPKLPKKKKD